MSWWFIVTTMVALSGATQAHGPYPTKSACWEAEDKVITAGPLCASGEIDTKTGIVKLVRCPGGSLELRKGCFVTDEDYPREELLEMK